jgi:acetyltransferase
MDPRRLTADSEAAAPVHLFRTRAGDLVRVRPFLPDEADRLGAHVIALSPASRRNRFLGGLAQLTPSAALRLIGHPSGPVTGLAVERMGEAAPLLVGEGVLAIGADGRAAELAVSVADAWQGRGIGRCILASIGLRAARAGAQHLTGELLHTNHRMRALARAAGFAVASHRHDARLLAITRRLDVCPGREALGLAA